MNEFALIAHFFAEQANLARPEVIMGIGDDCAIVEVPTEKQLLMTVDTLIEGVHFPKNTHAYDIGYKALAVNLSDLAAMGAEPSWFSLALTIPSAEEQWLHHFSQGLFALAHEFHVALIGGDTTKGPLSITIQAHGFVPKGKAITRGSARVDDWIYVTHSVGDAGLALEHALQHRTLPKSVQETLLTRLNRPYPRVHEGILLRDWAHAMIDISDGLIADLGHILQRSAVGAQLDLAAIPLSAELTQVLSRQEALHLALCAGDDYELCFTIAAEQRTEFEHWAQQEQLNVHCIGQIQREQQLVFANTNESITPDSLKGYTHF